MTGWFIWFVALILASSILFNIRKNGIAKMPYTPVHAPCPAAPLAPAQGLTMVFDQKSYGMSEDKLIDAVNQWLAASPQLGNVSCEVVIDSRLGISVNKYSLRSVTFRYDILQGANTHQYALVPLQNFGIFLKHSTALLAKWKSANPNATVIYKAGGSNQRWSGNGGVMSRSQLYIFFKFPRFRAPSYDAARDEFGNPAAPGDSAYKGGQNTGFGDPAYGSYSPEYGGGIILPPRASVVAKYIFGKIMLVIGSLFAAFTGTPLIIFAIADLSEMDMSELIVIINGMLIVFAASLCLMFFGSHIYRKMKRYKKYVSFMQTQNRTPIEYLANCVRKSDDFVRKDLEKMISKKYFTNVVINTATDEIIICETADHAPAYQPAHEAAAPNPQHRAASTGNDNRGNNPAPGNFCIYCGTKAEPGGTFCRQCGNRT